MAQALCALVITTLAFGGAQGENWSQFRGPTGQGHTSATGLPVSWSATENVVWRADVPGLGWSSPIAWENRIFLTTAVPSDTGNELDQTLQALCLDATTGRTLWTTPVFQQDADSAEPIHTKNSHASATPITDGEHVWVHFGPQGTACLTLAGEIVWRNSDIRYDPRHGNGGSPVLVDGLLVFSCDGYDVQFVVALDQRTGEIRWKTDRPPLDTQSTFSFSTPLVIDVDGRRQLISPGTSRVVAYDPATGRALWQADYDGYSVIPRPVYAHGLVFVSSGYNNPTLLALRPGRGGGRGDVTRSRVAWQSNRNAPHTPSLLAVGDELYSVTDAGVASCFDAQTGELHWQQRLGGNYSASPLYGDGTIYFQSEQGVGTVIRAGREYAELAKNDIGSRTLASYAVVDSDLLIRTESNLYRIGDAR